MPIKTGKQYIDSLRDGRRLYIDGKVVTDVTDYPPLQGSSAPSPGCTTTSSIPACATCWSTGRRRRASR